jgi:hypothetical protein
MTNALKATDFYKAWCSLSFAKTSTATRQIPSGHQYLAARSPLMVSRDELTVCTVQRNTRSRQNVHST